MRKIGLGLILAGVMLSGVAFLAAQSDGKDKKKGDRPAKSGGADEFVAKLMAFNKKKDGKLTKEELTDERLHRLFDRADANKDGVVTREELEALFAKESLPGGGGPGDGGPGGPKGKGDKGEKKGKKKDFPPPP